MKKQVLITVLFSLGVFLMIRTPLMAQSTGTPEQREAAREVEREAREAEREAREIERARSVRVVVPEIEVPKFTGHDFSYTFSTGSSPEKNSKLTISKDYDGESTMKTGTFNVAEGVTRIRISISGFVKSGKIGLEVYLPGKKKLQKLTIDDSANIEWSQSINIKEGDNQYFGEWTYVVNAENAKGFYSLSLNTY